MFYLHGGLAKIGLIMAKPGDVEVTLWPYVPMELDELMLYVAPLLADPHFDSAWDTAPPTNETLQFEQCDNSSFLQARFRLCGSLYGLSARVASISLDVWYPEDSQSSFFIVPRNEQDMKAFARKEQKLRILLKDAYDVAEWAVPTVRPSWWDETNAHIPWQCSFPSRREHLRKSDHATCMYLQRGCSEINYIGQRYNSSEFLDILDIAQTARTSQFLRVRTSRFVLCARESSKEPPEWALSRAWGKCEEDPDIRHPDIRHPPDLLCTFASANKGSHTKHMVGGIRITWFIGNLRKESSPVAQAVVAEGCAMLMKFSEEGQKKKKLESYLFLSAVDTGRAFSVSFVLTYCVDFSKWALDKKADLGKVVWKKLAASSWASDVLSALLSTSLAEGMMLAVINGACFGCVGLLQSWATKNPPKSPSWIGWSETELHLGLASGGGHSITSFLEVLAQWLRLPFVLYGITSLLDVGYGTAGGSSDTAVARFIPFLAHAGQNLTKVDLSYVFSNFLVVSNTASDLRLFGPLPLLQTMLLAAGAGQWHVSMSADAVKALFLDDAGNFKFPKLQNLSIELLDDRAAVELSNVMHGRKMKALRVSKGNLTDEGWATVNRLKKELGLATTS